MRTLGPPQGAAGRRAGLAQPAPETKEGTGPNSARLVSEVALQGRLRHRKLDVTQPPKPGDEQRPQKPNPALMSPCQQDPCSESHPHGLAIRATEPWVMQPQSPYRISRTPRLSEGQ